MTELNVYHHELRPNEYDEFYLKYEADKVIADLEESHKKEVTQLLMEIVELKEKYKELEKLHDKAIQACCDADKVIAHHKYKRCLAMADSLTWEFNYIVDYVSSDFPNIRFKRNHRLKWINKWLELAEQFKDKEEAK